MPPKPTISSFQEDNEVLLRRIHTLTDTLAVTRAKLDSAREQNKMLAEESLKVNAKLRDVYAERDAFKDQANEYRIENVTLKASLGNVVHSSTTPSVVEREESLRLATLQGAHVVSALFGSATKPLSPVSDAPLFSAEPVADDGTLTSPDVAAAPSMPPARLLPFSCPSRRHWMCSTAFDQVSLSRPTAENIRTLGEH